MQRIDKINELMKREISVIIQREFQDPKLQFVTITHVDVSKDLRYAKVGYSFLGNMDQLDEIQKRLDATRGFIRKLIGKSIRLRFTPELQFLFDKTIEYGARLDQTLDEIKKEKEMG